MRSLYMSRNKQAQEGRGGNPSATPKRHQLSQIYCGTLEKSAQQMLAAPGAILPAKHVVDRTCENILQCVRDTAKITEDVLHPGISLISVLENKKQICRLNLGNIFTDMDPRKTEGAHETREDILFQAFETQQTTVISMPRGQIHQQLVHAS